MTSGAGTKIFGVLAAFAGVALPTFAFLRASWASRAKKWESVPGRIVESKVEWMGEEYAPSIRFEYSVRGSAYSGTRVRFGLIQYNWSGPDAAICRRYSVGTPYWCLLIPRIPRTRS